ncbi:MAG: metalloregulator ArsR/SmtB family transcription factor [Pseudomonadota bacterium]
MESDQAIAAFSALSQATRLDILRYLVAAEPAGARPGELSRDLELRPNTLSANLTILLNAGLVCRRRDGRDVIYTANAKGLKALISFLLQDCCGGRPELCQPAIDAVAIAS